MAVHCILSSAVGTQNGSSWTNAYTSVPAGTNLVRGDTYYIGDGIYPALNFTPSTAGTSVITLQKATPSDHGPSTGWLDSFGDGEALFSSTGRCMTMAQDVGYITINGVYGTPGSTGTYGIRMYSSASRDADSRIIEYDSGGLFISTGANHNVTLQYIELDFNNGTAKGSAAASKSFLWNPARDCNNWLLQNLYIHDSSGYAIYCDSGGTGWKVDHCFMDKNGGAGGASAHYETMWWRNKVSSIVSNNTFRDTINGDITGWLMLGNNISTQVYGNLFYTTDPTGTTYAAGGNGIIATWSHVADVNDTLLIVNNTLVDIPTNGGFNPKIFFPEHTSEGSDFDRNVYIYNNLLMASSCSITVEAIGSSNAFNAFGNGATPSGSNQQTGVLTSIFNNYGADDFTLAAHTNAGSSAALASPDAYGTVRSLPDRGAFELGSTTTPATTSFMFGKAEKSFVYMYMGRR